MNFFRLAGDIPQFMRPMIVKIFPIPALNQVEPHGPRPDGALEI